MTFLPTSGVLGSNFGGQLAETSIEGGSALDCQEDRDEQNYIQPDDEFAQTFTEDDSSLRYLEGYGQSQNELACSALAYYNFGEEQNGPEWNRDVQMSIENADEEYHGWDETSDSRHSQGTSPKCSSSLYGHELLEASYNPQTSSLLSHKR